MKDGKIVKTYSAIVKGLPIEDSFVIEKPIKRESPNGMKRVCSSDGKYAKSLCTTTKRLENGNSAIEVKLLTGRTHQIRVQFASRGYTLYGDGKYGARDNDKIHLHSSYISFVHPTTKENMEFTQSAPWE